jgi:hypothetical protein
MSSADATEDERPHELSGKSSGGQSDSVSKLLSLFGRAVSKWHRAAQVDLQFQSHSVAGWFPQLLHHRGVEGALQAPHGDSRVLGVSVWLSLLGGMAACVVFLQSDTMDRYAALAIIAGLALASLCRFLRFWVLRKFRIKGVWGEFLELRISSEPYAKEFAELNRLSIEAA